MYSRCFVYQGKICISAHKHFACIYVCEHYISIYLCVCLCLCVCV